LVGKRFVAAEYNVVGAENLATKRTRPRARHPATPLNKAEDIGSAKSRLTAC